MIWAIASGLYGLAALVCARMLAGHLAYRWWRNAGKQGWSVGSRKSPTGPQWFWAAVLGIPAALVWPAVLALAVVQWPKIGAERVEELERRAERIREAEKELGL